MNINDLDDYHLDNLYWLLDQCRWSAADTGDWLGEVLSMLESNGANIDNANQPDLELDITPKGYHDL